MIHTSLSIVGGGPAGLCAAIEASKRGVDSILFERFDQLGGQLVKQTHKFFGSQRQYAGTRGFDIASKLERELHESNQCQTKLNTTVVGMYPNHVLTVSGPEGYQKIQSEAIIVASGASERYLVFENNDLPGIYGAGAVQTLMNQYGVLPGKRVVMVGSGNIGLIVSYQLLQAGVDVACVIDAAPKIGGYLVHASKLRRRGVPIQTSRTILRAEGKSQVERVVTIGLDQAWRPIPGTEETLECDLLCLAVGLSPLTQLLSMGGASMRQIQELGGVVAVEGNEGQTTLEGIYVAGDAAGIEEASSAMVEGRIAGIRAAMQLGHGLPDDNHTLQLLEEELQGLRRGPFGAKTRIGLDKLREEKHA